MALAMTNSTDTLKTTDAGKTRVCQCGHDALGPVKSALWTPNYPGHLPYCPKAATG
jgi:hypothetical protein